MIKHILKLIMLFTAFTFAQTKDTIQLNDVSITASRFKMEALSDKIIYTDSIKKYYSQETPSLFSNTTSIISQSDNGTPFGYTYFTLRGIGQNRINYTLNGIPLNDGEDLSVYTSNYTDLISSLKSIQIIRGAGVSSNGASSIAGLINLDLDGPFENKSGEFESMFGSFNSYKLSGKYNFGVKKGFGATVRLSSTATDGFRDYSSGKSYSLGTSIGWKSEKASIIFNMIQGATKNGQSWLPVPEGMSPTTNILTQMGVRPQYDDFNSGIYQLQFYRKLSPHMIFNMSYYATTINGNYDMPSFSDPNYIKNLKLKSLNLGSYVNVKYSYKNLILQPGVNFNKFQREHIGSSQIFSDYYSNTGYKSDYSGYIKSSYKLNKFILEGDIHLRNTSFSYEGVDINTTIFDYTFFNYSMGISYTNLNVFKPYIRFSHSNKEPSRTNIFGSFDNYTSDNISELISIKPESVNDIELGTKIKSNKFNGSFNLYAMLFKNEIISTGQLNSMGISQGFNVNKSQRLGAEGELNYQINKITLGTNFNISKNTIWINNDRLNPISSPGFISNLIVDYKLNSIIIGAQYKYVTYSYLDNYNKFVLPEYHLLDANIGYNINKSTSIKLFVNNILDKNWTLSGNTDGVSRNFYYSSGINFFTSFNYKF